MVQFIFFLSLIALGFFIGGWSERSHIRKLEEREAASRGFVITQMKTYLQPKPGGQPPLMVVSEVVIASDYFKTFAASLRNLFGGEVRSFERMMDRARREVNQRLIDEARSRGYNALCNVRINTANVAGMSTKANAMATIIGWGTAYEVDLPGGPTQPMADSIPRA